MGKTNKRRVRSSPVKMVGPASVKNLQEYLQSKEGRKDTDHDDNEVEVITIGSSDNERSSSDSSHSSSPEVSEEVPQLPGSPGSSFYNSGGGGGDDNNMDSSSSNLRIVRVTSLSPVGKRSSARTVEIVGSSSSEDQSDLENSPTAATEPRAKRTRRSTIGAGGGRTSGNGSKTDASSGINMPSPWDIPYPTPPSSSASSINSGDKDHNLDNSSTGRATRRSKGRETNEYITQQQSQPKRAKGKTSDSSSSTASGLEEKSKPVPDKLAITPKLAKHIRKYKKLVLKVELTSLDDNGEIPNRPQLGDDEVDDYPGRRPNLVKPTPIVSKHKGERHLIILPSLIHGNGLFTTNFLKAGEMIIEYAGEVVSAKEALDRQNYYIQRRINNYVMNIGKELHIDATNEGNCSRYINHSCEPNCTAEVLTIRGAKRVLIIALKDIEGGEELTYDYCFTSDELVPCFCNTPSCRLFLNHNAAKLKLKPAEIKSILQAHNEQYE